MNCRTALFSLFATFLWMAVSPAVAENWPIKHFKVVHSEPTVLKDPDISSVFDRVSDWWNEDDEEAEALRAWERLVEGYLHEIALLYEAQGFLPPDLPTVIDDGQTKLAVYLYDFMEGDYSSHSEVKSAAMGFAKNGCNRASGPRQPWMAIDKSDFLFDKADVSVNEPGVPIVSVMEGWKLYSTLAHELFHILQIVYDRRYGSLDFCDRGNESHFVIEGGATGAARFAVSRKFGERIERETRDRKYLGWFGYNTPFPQTNKGFSYFTSSFWFHLAERYGNLGTLAFLMRRPYDGNTAEARVRWLQEGLSAHPAIDRDGLYFVLPHFLAEGASYGGDRYSAIDTKRWMDVFISPCPSEKMSSEQVAEVTLETGVAALSGACVHLSWAGLPEDSRLEVEVAGPSEGKLDQLHLGYSHRSYQTGGELTGYRLKTQGCWMWQKRLPAESRREKTCVIGKPFIKRGLREGKPVKTWMLERERWGGDGELTLVLTNVPLKPGQEKFDDKWLHDVTIRAGFASTRSPDQELGSPEALPPGGSSPTGGPGVAQALLYGLGGGPSPRGLPSMVSIKVARGGPADSTGRGPQGNYVVVPDGRQQIGLGYTGPLHGTVMRETEDAPTKMISSALCENTDKPIGEVLVADERKLEVHIQAQLCSVPIGVPEPKITQEEFLNARLTLPFGWRYFTSSLPQDLVTPGISAYMRHYGYEVQGLTTLPFPFPGSDGDSPWGDTGTSGSSAGVGASSRPSVPACDCDCKNWEVVRQVSGCSDECDAEWRDRFCGPYLEAGLEDLDTETQRYQAEVSQLDVPGNVWRPWVLSFRDAGPVVRSEMWDALESYRRQQNSEEGSNQLAEIEREQAVREERASRYDAETVLYRDALLEAGYSEDEAKGLTEVFSISDAAMRQIFRNSIETRSN